MVSGVFAEGTNGGHLFMSSLEDTRDGLLVLFEPGPGQKLSLGVDQDMHVGGRYNVEEMASF